MEMIEEKRISNIISECIDRYLRNKLHNKLLYEAKKKQIRMMQSLKNGKVLHNTFLVFNIKKCDFGGVFSEQSGHLISTPKYPF